MTESCAVVVEMVSRLHTYSETDQAVDSKYIPHTTRQLYLDKVIKYQSYICQFYMYGNKRYDK